MTKNGVVAVNSLSRVPLQPNLEVFLLEMMQILLTNNPKEYRPVMLRKL